MMTYRWSHRSYQSICRQHLPYSHLQATLIYYSICWRMRQRQRDEQRLPHWSITSFDHTMCYLQGFSSNETYSTGSHQEGGAWPAGGHGSLSADSTDHCKLALTHCVSDWNSCVSIYIYHFTTPTISVQHETASGYFHRCILCREYLIDGSVKGQYHIYPSARAGYDTRTIFKRSLTGLNSEFSFS